MSARTPILRPTERAFVERARRAVLTTIGPDGAPRPVPICFVLDMVYPILYSPLDEKPKEVEDPRRLARVLDIERDPRVSVLVDRWDEDWSRLAWVRMAGHASIVEPDGPDPEEHMIAIAFLRLKHEQYWEQDLEHRPLIRVQIQQVTSWGAIRRGRRLEP